MGLLAHPLDAEGLNRAMSTALLQPPVPGYQQLRWIESWNEVSSPQVCHRSYVVTSWRDRGVDTARIAAGYGVTVSHEARGFAAPEDLRVVTVMRVSAPTASHLSRASSELRQGCPLCQIRQQVSRK